MYYYFICPSLVNLCLTWSPPLLEAFFNAIIIPLVIYEMIPENSCSAISIASFLVYFSTYVIILQENVGILIENQSKSQSKEKRSYFFSHKWLEFQQFYNFQINSEQISCKSFCFVVIYFITTRDISEI